MNVDVFAMIEQAKKECKCSESEVPKETKFPCKRCGGTGFIYFRQNGVDYACRCPECLAVRNQAMFLKESGITLEDYKQYTLGKFDTHTPMSYRMKRMALAYLEDENRKGIGYFGQPGTGKTHICIAICQAMHKEHMYWQYRHEIQKIKLVMYKDAKKYGKLMYKACTAPYLYIDDLFKGAIANGQLQAQDQQIMFEIINQRYIKKLPTMFSSEFFSEQIITADEAIGSRIKAMVAPYWLNITDTENRRLK